MIIEIISNKVFLFLLGLFLGNRLSIGRDKRKEFNQLAEPTRNAFVSAINGHGIPWIDDIAIFNIRNGLPFWKRRGFDNVVAKYKKSISKDNQNPDGMGGFEYIDKEKIIHAAKNLLKYIKRR